MSELIEFDAKNKKEKYLIGTDEVGRGPAAGDVYAAAVCFINPPSGILEELNDSKSLSESKRELLYEAIKSNSVWAIRKSSVAQIEKFNILAASLDAMKRACKEVIKQLDSTEAEVFVDGNKKILTLEYPQTTIIKGDSKSACIAAASIIAKVERDRAMKRLSKKFPQYCWDSNKGYLSRAHIEAIQKYGVTPYHRKLFVRNILQNQHTEQLKLI